MTRFEEVLEGVRQALTWASAAEIQELLEGLVEEQIISEAYGRTLSPHRFTEGIAPGSIRGKVARKPGSGQTDSHGSATPQTRLEFVDTHGDNSQVIPEPCWGPAIGECQVKACEDHCSVRFSYEITELLRSTESVPMLISDSERMDEGKSEDEKEWLGRVEEAARRIAVPLWQQWDRGRRMLLPLVPRLTTCRATSENAGTELTMEGETEVAGAYRTLDLCNDIFACVEAESEDASFMLDTEGRTDPLKGSCFPVEVNAGHFDIYRAAGLASPVEACTAMDSNSSLMDACLQGALMCLTGDGARCGTDVGFTDVADFLSPCAPEDTRTNAQENTFYSKTDHDVTLGFLDDSEDDVRMAYDARYSTIDTADLNTQDKERVDPNWGAKMQEVDQDQCIPQDFLPDDLSEFMNEDYLLGALFDEKLFNSEEIGDDGMPAELHGTGSHQQRQEDKLRDKTNNRRKRRRAPQPQRCSDETTPSRPKRPRPAERPHAKETQEEPAVAQSTNVVTEPGPAETAGLSATPPRILRLHPSIQFITIPDTPSYQVVQALRFSPPVIGLPLPNTAATPTYILVPATSPPCKRQVQPLSPVDGAVVPVQVSSSPTGSLSDTASKAVFSSCASPLSPSNELSPCKESPPPQSPIIRDIPQVVKDYVQEVKAHISQTCQIMEEGLSLTSHYVDMKVSQREILRSGKSTNKCLEKELVIMGDTDRQKSLLGQSQIFESTHGGKSKCYKLLLGNAGMGKTTLIRKLCLDWSRDCIPQFDFVFLLDGKALTLMKPTYSLQNLLLNLSSFAPSCMDPDAVYAQILAAPKRVLIIFDGFDELRDYEILLQTQEKDLITSLQRDSKAQTYTVRQLYSAILQRVVLQGCTLLLSTRPRGTASQLLRRADSFLEVCGFSPSDVETYLSQYFTDPTLRASALDCLKKCNYLHLLCWNPGLCRLVCMVLELSVKCLELVPRTLTGLCHQVLRLKMEMDHRSTCSQAEVQMQISQKSEEETQTQVSSNNETKSCHKKTQTKSRVTRTRSCTRRVRGAKEQENEEHEVAGEDSEKSVGQEMDRTEQKELLSELSSLAWDGVKANSSVLPTGRTLSAKVKSFGLRTRLLLSHPLKMRPVVSGDEMAGKTDNENFDAGDDHIVKWASPFLQSYLAGAHLSLSRSVSDRSFLQTLPFQSGPKARRRTQREEMELTQRFAVGLLFHNRAELQRPHSHTEASFRDMVASKQALVTKHLEALSHSDLTPAQVLEACHYVYEASFTHGSSARGSSSSRLLTHLAANLPEVLTFHRVPLNPPDVFNVENVLERGGTEGKSFCLDLEDSGIQVSGVRALVGLDNIKTYRACIADVITLWEQLEQSGEEGLLRGAVSKLNIHPLKATQVCHVEHLAKLVNIHMHKRLSDSCSQSDSILAEGVPAVKELYKLEFELGPEKGPLGLPKLWELLPGLHNLQHLDLENSKIGDKGAEKLADVLASLCSLEILNLSQNCIGDHGVKKLTATLKDLPRLSCLSLYSNVISDEGAESLAAVLPHMVSLTHLDVKYNKLTDVGAQSLGAILRNCQKIKTLRMWNQCIPYGVFERLQQQDSRILWH